MREEYIERKRVRESLKEGERERGSGRKREWEKERDRLIER